MIIQKISLSNFGVYAGIETIKPCSTSENGFPVTLIGGVNGAGKTTILEAVLLALYGKSSPAVREAGQPYQVYIDSFIHNATIKEAWIELLLEVPVEGNAVKLGLRRQWHKKKNQWNEDLRITRNDMPDLFLAKNWAYYVEDLVPSGLAGLFFFDGEKIISLAEEDTGESMKKAIYSVFGVDLVDRLIQDMTRLVKRHEANLYTPEMGKEAYHLEASGNELLSRIQIERQDLASIDTRLERLSEKAKRKEEQILKGGSQWQDQRQSLQTTKEALKEKLAEIRAEMITLAGGGLPLILVNSLLIKLEKQMVKDQSSRVAAQVLPLIEEQSNLVLELLNDNSVESYVVHSIEEMFKQKTTELNDLAATISPLYISDLALNQVEQLTGGKLTYLKDKAISLIDNYRSLENEFEQIERHLLVEVDHVGLEAEMVEYKEIQQSITSLTVERQLVSGRLAELTREFSDIEKKHQELLRQSLSNAEKEEESARIIDYALRTQETMLQFRQKLIIKKAKRLGESMMEAFQYLAHKKRLVSKIQIDPNTLSIQLYDSNGQEIAKQRLSAGEKQMLAISLLWGLAHSSGRMLPVIIDTPLGRLDSAHRQNFVSRYLPAASHQVIVLSTDTEITGDLYNRLKDNVGQEYWLDYSDTDKFTVIREGYFGSAACLEENYDRQAN